MMSRLLGVVEALLSPSNASPPLIEPSPMTATTLRSGLSSLSAATDMPSAALIELLAWPHVKVSYSLSLGVGKGARPWKWRLVEKRSRRPVRILCA